MEQVEDEELIDEECVADYVDGDSRVVEVTLALLHSEEVYPLQDSLSLPPPPPLQQHTTADAEGRLGGENRGAVRPVERRRAAPLVTKEESSDYDFFRPTRKRLRKVFYSLATR